MSFWWNYRRDLSDERDMKVGIESNDITLTFDGHFVCLFPRAIGEKDDSEAQARAERLVGLLNIARRLAEINYKGGDAFVSRLIKEARAWGPTQPSTGRK